jgi:hypothetical protein
VPANAHGTPGADDRVRGLPLPVIRPDVLHADDARLRPSERTPRLPSREPRTDPVDAAVEVVRCEEGEVAAEISVALDHVVGVRRDVLLVAREDDEFVALRELRAARDRVEIVVGEEVRAEPMSVEPCDEVEVPVVEAKRNPEVEIRPLKVDAPVPGGDVPRVAPAVSVVVFEVVCRPRVAPLRNASARRRRGAPPSQAPASAYSFLTFQ